MFGNQQEQLISASNVTARYLEMTMSLNDTPQARVAELHLMASQHGKLM